MTQKDASLGYLDQQEEGQRAIDNTGLGMLAEQVTSVTWESLERALKGCHQEKFVSLTWNIHLLQRQVELLLSCFGLSNLSSRQIQSVYCTYIVNSSIFFYYYGRIM